MLAIVWAIANLGSEPSAGPTTSQLNRLPTSAVDLFALPTTGPLGVLGLGGASPESLIPRYELPATVGCLLLPDIGNDRFRKVIRDAVHGFRCAVDHDAVHLAFADSITPNATQRARFAALVKHGPYDAAVITGWHTGSDGRRRVNVEFQATSAAGRSRCWRSRLTLTASHEVASLTAPVAARCR